MTTHFRTSNPSAMHRDSAIDKRKATVKAQVEKDWGIRPQNPVLKPSEASAFSTLQRQMAQQLDQAVQQVCARLDTLAGQLQAALTESLAADLERLRAGLRASGLL